MSRKFITICISLLLASASYAGAILGNWENTTGDGWKNWAAGAYITPLPTTVGTASYAQSTIGVTNGSHSLAVTVSSGMGQVLAKENWKNSGAPDYSGYVDIPTILANTKFQIDVTYDSASWTTGTSYAQLYAASFQTPSYGWHDVGGTSAHTGANGVVFSDTLNPGYTGGLPIVDPGTTLHTWTGTWTWDYSAILPGGSWSGTHMSTSDGYLNIVLNLQANTAGTFYFDNARFTPEPATIAMLGLGGLALIRRRR